MIHALFQSFVYKLSVSWCLSIVLFFDLKPSDYKSTFSKLARYFQINKKHFFRNKLRLVRVYLNNHRSIYIKEWFLGRYIIQGHLYPRMHFEVEPSELLTIPRCFKYGNQVWFKWASEDHHTADENIKVKKICF